MALDTALPYGLRSVNLTAYTDAAGTVLATTSVKLPIARTLNFTDSEDFEDLRGDDVLVTSHGKGTTVAWELESGGLPFEAFQVMSGGTLATTGTGTTEKKVFSRTTLDTRPWFRMEGQAISDSGGDLHTVLYRCKATGDLSGEFSDGSFFLTSAKGSVVAATTGATATKLYDFVQNAQVTAFVEPGAGSGS